MAIRKNNYDMNSKGKSIEAVCFWDGDAASFIFSEAFETLERASKYSVQKYWYVDHGNLPGHGSVSFTLKGERDVKLKFLEDHTPHADDRVKWSDSDIDDTILQALSEKPNAANYDHLNDNDLEGYALELVPSKAISWVKVHGCSQGDYAEVAYCPEDAKEAYGSELEYNGLREQFTNLIFSAPVYALVTVDGIEYDYREYSLDEYDWPREEFAEAVAKDSGANKDEILALLPKELEYA